MAQNAPSFTNDPGRVDSVRIARRQLLTARATSEQPPPRVVLHLPDLNALDGVVLGPPKPITHRRFDAAHTADDAYPPPSRETQADARQKAPVRTEPTLANVFRVPLGKLMPQLASGTTLEKIGKLIILVQQPKMLLAAIVAAALQLAAVLAMFVGEGTTSDQTKSPADDHHDHHDHGHVAAHADGHFKGFVPTTGSSGQIRTPASTGFATPSAPSTPGTSGSVAGPTLAPTLAPTLPPPQSLPGAAPGEELPWQAPANMATSGAPTLTPPKSAGKPTRAKLVGTIKSLGTSGATP
ncbi:MAG: hypothetical protein C0483_02085 [Pirellula sp.]|nr:hypothetical protein [Pirellula sp.]